MAPSAKSDAEGDELLQLCRQRTPISGSVKVRVLTRARSRCECCGAGCCLANPAPTGPGGGPDRAQEPRRHRRPQQPAGPRLPLQGRQARRLFADARGRTNFRSQQASGRVLLESKQALCVADAYPVTPGHSLAHSQSPGQACVRQRRAEQGQQTCVSEAGLTRDTCINWHNIPSFCAARYGPHPQSVLTRCGSPAA
jgi:hypothetical protein